jgi:hypothetical protein
MDKILLISDTHHGMNDIYTHSRDGLTISNNIFEKILAKFPASIEYYILAEATTGEKIVTYKGKKFNIVGEITKVEGFLMKMIDGLRGAILVPSIREYMLQMSKDVYSSVKTGIYYPSEKIAEVSEIIKKIDRLLQIIPTLSLIENRFFYLHNDDDKKHLSDIYTSFATVCIEIADYLGQSNQRYNLIKNALMIQFGLVINKILNEYKYPESADLESRQSTLYQITLALRDSYVCDTITKINYLPKIIIFGANHTHYLSLKLNLLDTVQIGGKFEKYTFTKIDL